MNSWVSLVSAAVDLLLFPLTAIIAYFLWRGLELDAQQKRVLAATAAGTVLIKIGLASLGHNYDVDSYGIVSSIVRHGLSVYELTERYNYGPIWSWVVSGFSLLASPESGEHFHMWIAALLAMGDVLVALLLARAYNWTAAMVFLLCPIGLITSGYHTQFDNLAVLLGLAAWLALRNGDPKPKTLLFAAVSLGVSLVLKHVLFLFPVWLFFWKPLGDIRKRLACVLIPYGMFAAGFLPWWGDPASRAGIIHNVFRYNSFAGTSWPGMIYAVLFPFRTAALFESWFGAYKTIWLAFMLLAGIVIARRAARELFLLYLLVLYASTPSLQTEYACIPLAAAAVYYFLPESWVFMGTATLSAMTCRFSIGFLVYDLLPSSAPPIVIRGKAYFAAGLLDQAFLLFLVASQLCAVVMLFRIWRLHGKPAPQDQLRQFLWEGPALLAAGGFPIVLRFLFPQL